jgi:glycosyltransferase involved in cell wall biosynthesis
MYRSLKDSPRYEPFLLAATDDPVEAWGGRRLLRYDGDDHVHLFVISGLGLDDFFHVGADLTALADFLLCLRPEVIHLHHYMFLGVDVISYLKSLLPEVKIVLTLHEFFAMCANVGSMVKTNGFQLCYKSSPADCHRCFPERQTVDFSIRDQLFRLNFDLVDHFIASSNFQKQRYLAWGLDADRLSVMDNGRPVHPRPSRPKRGDHRAFVAGYFGQIVWHKGLDTLLRAAAEYLQIRKTKALPEIRFAVHGTMQGAQPEAREAIQKQLADCRDVAHYHGAYDREQMPELLAHVDCVVVPSRWWENAPLVINEAFLAGLPVICSNIGGMAEKVTDRVNGLHFLVGDHVDFLDKLLELASTPELYEQLVAGIPAVLSQEEMAQRMHDLYDRLRSQPVPLTSST